MLARKTCREGGIAGDDQLQVPAALLPKNESPVSTQSGHFRDRTKSLALLRNGTIIPVVQCAA
jgi:hypothetical protein